MISTGAQNVLIKIFSLIALNSTTSHHIIFNYHQNLATYQLYSYQIVVNIPQ